MKTFLAFLAAFPFSYFLTPDYAYSYSKDQICFNDKFWKPIFHPCISFFIFDRLRNSNVRSRIRTSGRNSQRPAEIPNVGGPFLDLLW